MSECDSAAANVEDIPSMYRLQCDKYEHEAGRNSKGRQNEIVFIITTPSIKNSDVAHCCVDELASTGLGNRTGPVHTHKRMARCTVESLGQKMVRPLSPKSLQSKNAKWLETALWFDQRGGEQHQSPDAG